jgi:hypothetical protein
MSGEKSGALDLPPAFRELLEAHFQPPSAAVGWLSRLIREQLAPDPEVARALAASRPFAPALLVLSALELVRSLPVDRPVYRRLLSGAFAEFLRELE